MAGCARDLAWRCSTEGGGADFGQLIATTWLMHLKLIGEFPQISKLTKIIQNIKDKLLSSVRGPDDWFGVCTNLYIKGMINDYHHPLWEYY
jgi:hypothetical protein